MCNGLIVSFAIKIQQYLLIVSKAYSSYDPKGRDAHEVLKKRPVSTPLKAVQDLELEFRISPSSHQVIKG